MAVAPRIRVKQQMPHRRQRQCESALRTRAAKPTNLFWAVGTLELHVRLSVRLALALVWRLLGFGFCQRIGLL